MSRLISTEFLKEAKKAQRQHIKDMSRNITIVTGNTVTEQCPNCYYDYMTGGSAAIYSGLTGTVTVLSGTADERTFEGINFRQKCPRCNGAGYFSSKETKTVKAHVHWPHDKSSLIASAPGYEGQARVKLKSSSALYSDYLEAEYFIVDGINVEPESVPVVRSIGQYDGVVEVWCKTVLSGDKSVR